MIAKRSIWALAVLLALPSASFALGLGDIHLLSALNAPLDAEIELVDVAPDEVNTVQAQLASRETFDRYGLEWPGYLAGVQVRTTRTSDGREVIKLKSTEPIPDPFLTLLVQVNWSRGRLVREYTMLFDPPVFAPGPATVNAAVSAPATGTGAREGAIARSSEVPAPAAPDAAAATTAAPPPATAAAAPSARTAPREGGGEGVTHLVHRGETLSAIAASAAGASADSPQARSWMLAIYQANPRAFEQNMNLLHSGAVLRMPDAATAAAVSPAAAAAEIRRQYAAWRGSAPESAAAQSGRLKLVTPAEGASAGATPGAAASGEVSALQGRVHDLEGQLAESKRLLDMKNAELARMQSQLAAKQSAPAAPPPAPPAAETAPPPAAAPAAPQPPATAAAPPAPPPAAPAEEQPATPPPPPVIAAAPPPEHKAPPSPAGGSLLDTLKSYWWVLLLLLLVVIGGLVGSRALRSRRASEFDDSLGRLAVAGAAAAEPAGGAGRRFESDEPLPMRATPASPVPEDAFLVEESASHERPRFGAAGAPAPAPRHVAADDTISSETAINLDQGDPLAEADFHMAYGLYDQAADLIRIAISREPTRRDLKLKLLEVFFVWGNKEQFLQTARELAESRANAAPGEWEKILIMGKQLAPEDPLFSGGGAVTGAAAGGVDLDLEGGQSRVDFDLLGEPVPGDAPQGLDLDIGAAVGEGAAGESTTNVTDRNAALLDTTFSSTATTGTTRQMTQRVRPAGATGEMEGPTVEQPALATAENPTVRQKLETAMRQSGPDQTAELAIDDLGLDVGSVDTVDQPGPAAAAASTPDSPTLVAGLDEQSRQAMEAAEGHSSKDGTVSTGAWQFEQNELEAALTQTSLAVPDTSATSRLAALKGHALDVDVGDATGTHAATVTDVDLDVGAATGSHPSNGTGGLDLDVGTATVPDTAFAATQKLSADDLALPDLEPVTMSEVGTKLDLARAYMDMGDPDGARNILEEVLNEGSAAQKQEAQRLMESLPG
ncbi:MAG TPA: FimV/HubP family polar landmark protein [Steroidobacteraceae bacterium]|nr:FimV/HubP family polar landmark protein [Steroidobacteraceae bacterium]